MNINHNSALSKDLFARITGGQKSPPLQNLEQRRINRPKVVVIPTFTKAPVVQAIDNLQQAGEAIRMLAERTYKKMAESKRGKMLIATADEYRIPYDPNNIDWLRLISQTKEYNSLLNQAQNYSLSFDTNIMSLPD